MSCQTPRRLPSITARPSPDEKEEFAGLAAARGVSEGALALSAIRAVIAAETGKHPIAPRRHPASDRITVRLRPGDHQLLSTRAAQRELKTSTYIATLVRAHLAADPPLTATELEVLKRAVALLGVVGGVLARAVRTEAGVSREMLKDVRNAVTHLEQRVVALARVAIVSWETGSD